MVPSHYTFLGYWRAMAMKSIKLIFSSWRLVGAIVGFLFFIVMLFNKEIGDKLFEQWKGFPRWWSAAIVLILFLWGLMKAIYERDENLYLAYKELEDRVGVIQTARGAKTEQIKNVIKRKLLL